VENGEAKMDKIKVNSEQGIILDLIGRRR